MHIEQLRQPGQRPVTLDGGQSHLRLESRCVWFRRVRFVMVSPDMRQLRPLSGRKSTCRSVQIHRASSNNAIVRLNIEIVKRSGQAKGDYVIITDQSEQCGPRRRDTAVMARKLVWRAAHPGESPTYLRRCSAASRSGAARSGCRSINFITSAASRTNNSQIRLEMTVALRGAFPKTAISPKKSPCDSLTL